MKRQVKNIALAAMITTGMIGGTTAFAGEDEKLSIEDNQLKDRVEYKDMQATMERIEDDQERIEFYEKELHNNREANKTIAAHMSKKELKKAKADLKRDKKYLRVDKRDLRKDQRVAKWEAYKAEFHAKRDLRQAKRAMRKAERKGEVAEKTACMKKVSTLEKEAALKEQKRENLVEDVDEFFEYLDQEIDETLS